MQATEKNVFSMCFLNSAKDLYMNYINTCKHFSVVMWQDNVHLWHLNRFLKNKSDQTWTTAKTHLNPKPYIISFTNATSLIPECKLKTHHMILTCFDNFSFILLLGNMLKLLFCKLILSATSMYLLKLRL